MEYLSGYIICIRKEIGHTQKRSLLERSNSGRRTFNISEASSNGVILKHISPNSDGPIYTVPTPFRQAIVAKLPLMYISYAMHSTHQTRPHPPLVNLFQLVLHPELVDSGLTPLSLVPTQ